MRYMPPRRLSALKRCAVLALVATHALSLAASPHLALAATSIVLTPVADAMTNSSTPTRNYGKRTTIGARSSSSLSYRSYLKFTVPTLNEAVSSIKLRLNVVDAGPDGGNFYLFSNAWDETTVTWANAPPIASTPVASVRTIAVGTWIELDVTAAVAGAGTYSFAVQNASSDSVFYASRESANDPQLVVTTSPTPTPPVAAFRGTPTSGEAPLTVDFTDTSSGSPTSWAWDFQDDGTVDSTDQNPSFTYPTAGTYDVELRVANGAGSDGEVKAGYITATTMPPPSPIPGDPVLIGAGDIASCLSSGDEATADLLDGIAGTVFTTGDNAYETGTSSEFTQCYEPSWGRHKNRTKPSPGNHDYQTSGAAGYFGYFGAAAGEPNKGYYAYDLGSWRVYSLNSNCTHIGGCGIGSAQEQWLRADLAANARECVGAYWHDPLFSSGFHGSATIMRGFWKALYDADAEFVVVGHDHDYERFAPQDAMGNADPAHGLREFVVGTGGESSRAFTTLLPNSEARNTGTHGIIRLTLNAGGFDWEFVPQAGKSFRDSGSASCHFPDPLDTVAPGAPQDVTALAPSPDQIRLSWRAATDDLGVTGYEIERNGVPLMTLAPSTMFTDDSVFSGVGYTYRVRARDRGGNWSSYSSPATVTTPVASSRVFDDGFESGDLTRWTRCTNVTIANQGAYTGGFAARAASTGLATYCQKTLDQADTELYYRVRVKVVSVGASAVDLMMLRSSTGALIASVYRTNTGKLALYNGTSKASLYSPTSIVTGSWYELQLRVRVDGTAGSTEVWSNGTKIAELSQTQNVGTTSIGQLQLGGTTTGRTYELVFDDIAAAGAFIAP